MGGILDVKWAHDGIVMTGHYCTAQGIIQQIGDLGVELTSLIITIHAFVVVAVSPGEQSERVARVARLFAFGIVALASLFIALWVGISNHKYRSYEAPTPYWCWISPGYGRERIAGEYIWLWMAWFTSVIVFIPLYFWARSRTTKRAALGMLRYPLAYSIILLPISIARWVDFRGGHVPSVVIFFSVSLFNLSGAINVLLFLIMRPQLLLFSPPEESPEALVWST